MYKMNGKQLAKKVAPGLFDEMKSLRNKKNRFIKRVVLGDPYSIPASESMGGDRGKPIDRYYIEKFLFEKKQLVDNADITLEIADDEYSKLLFPNSQHKILTYDNSVPKNDRLMIGDLTDESTLEKSSVNCFICTQTLNFIYEVDAAVRGMNYVLKDNGTALVTVSGISQLSPYDYPRWGDYWRFTDMSIKRLFERYFDEVEVETYGSLPATLAFLQGMSVEDVANSGILEKWDAFFPITIGVIAKKRSK